MLQLIKKQFQWFLVSWEELHCSNVNWEDVHYHYINGTFRNKLNSIKETNDINIGTKCVLILQAIGLIPTLGSLPPILPMKQSSQPMIVKQYEYNSDCELEKLFEMEKDNFSYQEQKLLQGFIDGSQSLHDVVNVLRGGELINNWQLLELLVLILAIKYTYSFQEAKQIILKHIWGDESTTHSNHKFSKYAQFQSSKNSMRLQMKSPSSSTLNTSSGQSGWQRTIKGTQIGLKNKSAFHLTSKHGHDWGINDILPNQPTKNTGFNEIRTRTNTENLNTFVNNIFDFLQSRDDSQVRDNVTFRGKSGYKSWFCEVTEKVITAEPLANGNYNIVQANQLTPDQFQRFLVFNRVF